MACSNSKEFLLVKILKEVVFEFWEPRGDWPVMAKECCSGMVERFINFATLNVILGYQLLEFPIPIATRLLHCGKVN